MSRHVPAAPAAPPARLWADVRAALRGVPRDYTTGHLGRAVVLLAIPMVLEMSMQSIFAVVDVYFVGRIGPDAVAVVGISDSLLALIFAVAIGLSMGAAATVARRVGEGSPERAAEAAVQSILCGLAISIPLGVLGVVYAADLLELLGATPALAASGRGFNAIMLGGNATVILLFMINGVFRGAGDPVLAMRALAFANALNIALDPLLIFGWGPVPTMGLEGAAIATTFSRGMGVLYQLRELSNREGRLAVDWRRVRVDLPAMGRLMRVSGIGIIQYLVATASFVGLIRILAPFGETVLAGYTVAVRIIIFILLPAWGVGNAAATLVGQNLGAHQPDRAERAVWFTARLNTVFLGLVGLGLLVFARPIAGVLTSEADVQAVAALCLQTVAYSYVVWGFGLITVLAFNGAGDTTTPTWINLFALWLVQIPLAWTLSTPMGLGPRGVFVAIAIGQLIVAATGVVLFRRGGWKARRI